MPTIADYIIKLSICFAIVFLFYQLVLRNLTFYKWNRFYLVAYTLLSFFIPFINIMPFVQKSGAGEVSIINMVPAWQQVNTPLHLDTNASTEDSAIWSIQQIVVLIVIAVSTVLLLRMIAQLISLRRTIKQAQLISDKDVKLYNINKNIIPFSFGNSIFINTAMHNEQDLKEIIRHEFVHVKQKHSIDILWAELLCIINWFNPFVWFLRHAIRQNLEFLADNKVVENGMDKTEYQYLLLKVMGNNHFAIASPFNFSSLKRRIFMMNKIKTAKVHLLKFIFILPLVVVSLLAFRSNTNKASQEKIFTVAGIVVDNETLKPIDGVLIKDVVSGIETVSDEKGYYALKIPITKKDSLTVSFWYKKEGYPSADENGSIMASSPVYESNDIIILSIPKGKTGTGIHGFGTARVNGQVVKPNYDLVYATYLSFLENKKVDSIVKNSSHPIQIINGVPYAVGNGAMAWFNKEETEASSEYKVWFDGKIITIDEANKSINRFDVKGVSTVAKKNAKQTFGEDCNILVLVKDSAFPTIKRSPENKSSIKPIKKEIQTAYFITPFLMLKDKNLKIQASGPFSGKFVITDGDTAKATSESGFTYNLNPGDVVKLNGETMKPDQSYPQSPNTQFKLTAFADIKHPDKRRINITTVPL